MITVCNFIRDITSLRRVGDIQNPDMVYQGILQELASKKFR